jgi:hypothetical protein
MTNAEQLNIHNAYSNVPNRSSLSSVNFICKTSKCTSAKKHGIAKKEENPPVRG